ncbi:hypothetical protein, partial [Burkholderia cenocepacia]
SNSYVNLKIATCLVRYADDRLIDQRFPNVQNRSRYVLNRFRHQRRSISDNDELRFGPFPDLLPKQREFV